MKPLIEVTDLCKDFNGFKAVHNLSFTVPENSVFGFLGQNGAGKSTTLRMMLSLIQPSAGNIQMFGYPLATHRREVLRQVGAVIEKPDLYKYVSALDNLKIFAALREKKFADKELKDHLAIFSLADRANSKVGAFSQGMKQRLGIAVALLHNPALVILDEPTNGLDPQGIADMRTLIMHLKNDLGKTVIISSHLLKEISEVADYMLIIHKGEKKVEGQVSELFNPSETLVQLQTGDNSAAVEHIKRSVLSTYFYKEEGKQLLLKMHKDKVPQALRDLTALPVDILSYQSIPSLEDYFLQITKDEKA